MLLTNRPFQKRGLLLRNQMLKWGSVGAVAPCIPLFRQNSALRSDQVESGKIVSVPFTVPGEKRHASHRSVNPDKEVGEGRNFSAAFPSVLEKDFSGEKGGLPGERVFPEEQGIEDFLQILDRGKAYRYLCIDDGIDDESVPVCLKSQLLGGPCEPRGIVRKDIENNVTVDKDFQFNPL